MFGISAALTTPFKTDGSVDTGRLNAHIDTVLGEGCNSVTLFGTTGEGASVATDARIATMRAVIDAGVAPEKLITTLHGAAHSEVANEAIAAIEMGVTRFLLPPPCYFNAPPEDGLYDWFAAVLSRLQGSGAQVIFYHIPQVIGVGLPIAMVARLKVEFPQVVIGVKDSSGDFDNTKNLLKLPGLDILIGDERLLAAGARLGASGSISGIANLFSARLAQMLASGKDDAQINQLVDTVLQFAVIPAIKSLVAHRYADPEWHRTCPPLIATSDQDVATLAMAYDAIGADP